MQSSTPPTPKSNHSIETLIHFNCRACSKWWSVGDADRSKTEWYCPWCGLRQTFDLTSKSQNS
jgi:transcription elongation factor Elf1